MGNVESDLGVNQAIEQLHPVLVLQQGGQELRGIAGRRERGLSVL